MVVHGLRGQKGNISLSFCRSLPLLQGAGVCFLRSNGKLGKYSRQKSLIKEKNIRNQRGSFPIGPMLTRSGNVYVIKNTIPPPASILPAWQNAVRLVAAMAEWLRRLTRNQMGSSRLGSNPARSVKI